MGEGELPFFVYGTLRPGEPNHDLCLRGRTSREVPARLEGAVLYDGPGYPYAVEAPGTVLGDLITARPGAYAELLTVLDELEDYLAPGHPRNLYERVAREVRAADGTPVRAWVYFAAARVARELRARGRLIVSGDWLAHVTPYASGRRDHPGRPAGPPAPPAPPGPRTL
ncbi:gamma-glutamylcyclotransferase family protein [Streptomyces sp. GMY02]|uniref:gamma-glutamylcyclotransferase family protein n=1 Tax=Streptomyces sp. GMY02 TaxID=1333528 RepID=UPI0020B7E4D8|nr:gamma-glutamylcyclotransferase family protein [Streptomyces sp. GMY02]